MSHDRNINWLNDRRVVYRREPISDKPTIETDQYKYYENGTYEAFHLFNSKAKITTYKSLKWHMLVLYYLNEKLLDLEFASICHFLADKNNGFVTFFIKSKVLHEMIKDVINQGGDPPKNKLRKVIFKPYSGLDLSGKLKIVGQLIGRSKIDNGMIYDSMLYIKHYLNKKITIKGIANILGCSTRTIYRNMDNSLKIEKYELNEEV
jgi:hypothetical protein